MTLNLSDGNDDYSMFLFKYLLYFFNYYCKALHHRYFRGPGYASDFIHKNIRLSIFSVIPYCLNINANILKTCNLSPHFVSTAESRRQKGLFNPTTPQSPKSLKSLESAGLSQMYERGWFCR